MLTQEEYRKVARIHSEGICKGFLSSLGVRFLSLLYEAIDRSNGSVLLVARIDNEVVGFVAGTGSIGEVYRMMLESWPRLVVALLPVLLSPSKIWRIAETVLFSRKGGSESSDLPQHELLSISVLKEYRGQSVADRLFDDLVQYFRGHDVEQFKIVVGDALVPAHKFYSRMGAKPFARAEVHKGSGSVIYIKDIK